MKRDQYKDPIKMFYDVLAGFSAHTTTVAPLYAAPSKRRRGPLHPSRGRRQVAHARSSGRHDWRRRLARQRGR